MAYLHQCRARRNEAEYSGAIDVSDADAAELLSEATKLYRLVE